MEAKAPAPAQSENNYYCAMKNEKPFPLAYIITYRTYATWLHGDARTSVDRNHNTFLTPRIKENSFRYKAMQTQCSENPFLMNGPQRKIVLQSIIKTCELAQWYLYAAHIRTNHTHVIVKAFKAPEKVAVSLKAYATRDLKLNFPELNRKHFWAKGESTGYIFQSENLFRAIQYAIHEQGREMAFYCDPEYIEVIQH